MNPESAPFVPNEDINIRWQKQHLRYPDLYTPGYFTDQIEHNPAALNAFKGDIEKVVGCIDGGIHSNNLHLAGSGILLPQPMAVEVIQSMGAEGIISHEKCGAAGIAAANQGVPLSQADELGMYWAQDIADKTGIPYLGHVPGKKLKRPVGYHDEKVAYVIGTDLFNRAAATEVFPSGFTISAGRIPKEIAVGETLLSASIALGPHGFGTRFTEENPFLVVNILHPNRAPTITKPTLDLAVEQFGGRVRVEEFFAPSVVYS